jgi:hypothetical protein
VLAEYKTKTNIGIGLGIVGQFVGRSLTAAGGSQNPAVSFLGVAVIIGAIVAFLYGCRSYAIGKGYHPAFGFFGLLSCIGLLVLVFLKDKYPDGVAKARLAAVSIPPRTVLRRRFSLRPRRGPLPTATSRVQARVAEYKRGWMDGFL